MRIRLPISVIDRSQITNLPVDTQILKGRTTWRILPSILLILHDFDHLPRFFSVYLSDPISKFIPHCTLALAPNFDTKQTQKRTLLSAVSHASPASNRVFRSFSLAAILARRLTFYLWYPSL